MRQTYETADNRAEEKKTATAVATAWKCDVKQLRKFAGVDVALLEGRELKAIAEIKRRANDRTAYPTFMVSLEKWTKAKGMGEACGGIPVLFIVEWNDGIFWVRQDEVDYTVGVGGREDRNDPEDMELCAFIKVEHFKPLLKSAH